LFFILGIFIFTLQFVDHTILPLYPKTEWIQKILHLEWNFLFPFTGGSGPTGFYVSFLFLALIWVVTAIFVAIGLKFAILRKKALFFLLILGVIYNLSIGEEYLFGKINGHLYSLFEDAKQFIIQNDQIKRVVVYNDIGGLDIARTGKYARRMYAAPQFENTYKDFFKDFKGHVLYIDIPQIGENNFYSNYLNSCETKYQKRDNYISAKILECP
jgi:hypothetical protein